MQDKEIYEQIKSRNEDGLKELLNQYELLYYKIISDVLGTYCHTEDIEDCLSESLTYIWFHIELYKHSSASFKTWTVQVVYSRALNKRKALENILNKQKHIMKQTQSENFVNLSAEETYLSKAAYHQLISEINLLKEPMKSVIAYRYLHGKKPREISQLLNLSVISVNNYIYKAKKILKRRWNNEEENR